MEERFRNILPDEYAWFGTFHSFFYYILKKSYLSIPNRFISTKEKQHILHGIMNEVLMPGTEVEYDDVERMLSLYMNCGLSMQQIPQSTGILDKQLKEMYHRYHRALVENRFMDFDDLMVITYQLLKENPELRDALHKQFSYILIDECQDMNVLQYEIIKLLAGPDKNVFMVGDDDQSVYRFRGARVELMQRFVQEFEPVTQINLDTNFRSTAGIVKASQRVIAENHNRFAKSLKAYNTEKEGLIMKAFVCRDDMFEEVLEGLGKAEEDVLNNCAIIYRTNQELRRMAYKLRQRGIAYQAKEESKSIFDEAWYLDVEAYILLALGNRERQYILRVANKPNRAIKREQLLHVSGIPFELEHAVKPLSKMRPYLAIQYIWNGIGYGKWLERKLINDTEKWTVLCEQFEEMVQEMREFSSLEEWLEYVEADRFKQKVVKKSTLDGKPKGVQLFTMHASKGLEFDCVYLLDVNKGKVPKGGRLSIEEIEEERRLFYVAMTRAKKQLHIYYVKGTKDHMMHPSIFIEKIMR